MCASKRLCVDLGYVSGFGPFESTLSSTKVACVTGAVNINTSYTVLDSFNDGCDGVTSSWGPYCHSAIHRFCLDQGHEGGFGTVESQVANDIAWVTCVDE